MASPPTTAAAVVVMMVPVVSFLFHRPRGDADRDQRDQPQADQGEVGPRAILGNGLGHHLGREFGGEFGGAVTQPESAREKASSGMASLGMVVTVQAG